MANKQREFVIQLSQIADALVIALVFWLAHTCREELAFRFPLPVRLLGWFTVDFAAIAPFQYYKWLYLIILPVGPFLLDVNGFYARSVRRGPWVTLWTLLKSVALCGLVAIAAMYFLGLTGLSRSVIVLFGAFTVATLLIRDRLFRVWLARRSHTGRHRRPIVLVGSPERNAEFEKLLVDHPEWDFEVLARVDPTAALLESLPPLLHRHPVSCVVFNVSQTTFAEVEKAILACEIEGVEAWLVADFVRTSIARAVVEDFHGKPLLVFRTTPDVAWQLAAKRILDIGGATLGLAVLGPLVILPAAIGIRLTSPGPIVFRQRRSGLHGRPFWMLKLRSMIDNAEMQRAELAVFNEMSGPVFKMTGGPRVTPWGRFLRKTSIDELPQLWNVFWGDMSLVGPRPLPIQETAGFDPWHRRRLSMKPGLTCLWQISGRNQIDFEKWVRLDLEYIDRWSLWLDLQILLRTLPVVITGLGAK